MDEFWNIFEKNGSIHAYLVYKQAENINTLGDTKKHAFSSEKERMRIKPKL